MKSSIFSLTAPAFFCLWAALGDAANAQWYTDPKTSMGNSSNNPFANPLLSGSNSLLYGNGYLPGSGILPGGGIFPGATNAGTATTGAGDSADSGAAASAGGYSFTSDPVSAYTNAVYSGMANVIRAEGRYNRDTARGMIDYETARSMYVENQLRVYSARRSLLRAQLAARAEDIEYQTAAEARARAFLAAHRPLPLDSRRLDYATGRIVWPTVLETPDFDELRKQVESDFEARAKSGFDADATIEMKKHVQALRKRMHDEVVNIPLENYSQARQFLDQLYASLE